MTMVFMRLNAQSPRGAGSRSDKVRMPTQATRRKLGYKHAATLAKLRKHLSLPHDLRTVGLDHLSGSGRL
jgi:hypothetical protein